MATDPRPYSGFWESSDGLSEGYVNVYPPDGHWPAMVSLELDVAGTITVEDAKDLAAHIGAAAELADLENRRRARASSSEGVVVSRYGRTNTGRRVLLCFCHGQGAHEHRPHGGGAMFFKCPPEPLYVGTGASSSEATEGDDG